METEPYFNPEQFVGFCIFFIFLYGFAMASIGMYFYKTSKKTDGKDIFISRRKN